MCGKYAGMQVKNLRFYPQIYFYLSLADLPLANLRRLAYTY